MKNKRKIIFMFIIVAFTVLSIIIKYNRTGDDPNNQLNEQPMSSWQTYKQQDLGFSFDYPKNSKTRNDEDTVSIILPEKYPHLKDINYYDEDIVTIKLTGNRNDFGKNLEEIKNRLSGRLGFIKQTQTDSGETVLIYSRGQIFIVGKEKIFGIHLLRQDPSYMIQNVFSEDELSKLKENYANEILILEKIYQSFIIIE